MPASGVVGRVLECGHLAAAQKAAFAGEGHRVVLLSGEPGIGKTTLAADLAQQAHGDGATVLYGRCDEDLGVPYQPFVEALGGFVANAPEDALLGLDGRHLSELSRLLPQVRDRIPGLAEPPSTDADAERYLLFGAITAVLADGGDDAPVVVVLDDLHWADKPTVLLLRHLVATLDRAEVLLVGTYRDSDLTAGTPVDRRARRAAARASGGTDRSRGPRRQRGGGAAGEHGRARDGHDGIELAHAVRRETGGNPFFTAEVLRHLAETGAIRQEDGRWVATVELSQIGLPESVREVVGQRVRRLGDDVATGPDDGVGHRARLRPDAAGPRRGARRGRCARRTRGGGDARRSWPRSKGGPSGSRSPTPCSSTPCTSELSASRRARTHRRIGELLEVELRRRPRRPHRRAGPPLDSGHHAGRRRQGGRLRPTGRGTRARRARADEAIRWFSQAVELLDADPHDDPLQRLDVAHRPGRRATPGGRSRVPRDAARRGRRGGPAGRHRPPRGRRAGQPAGDGQQRRGGRRGTDRHARTGAGRRRRRRQPGPRRRCWRRSPPSSPSAGIFPGCGRWPPTPRRWPAASATTQRCFASST